MNRLEEILAEKERRKDLKMTTPLEAKFQHILDECRITGYVREHEVCGYLIDFAFIDQKLGIEVDGRIHETKIERDEKRDKILTDAGWKIVHIPSRMVWNCYRDSVLWRILEAIWKTTAVGLPPFAILEMIEATGGHAPELHRLIEDDGWCKRHERPRDKCETEDCWVVEELDEEKVLQKI